MVTITCNSSCLLTFIYISKKTHVELKKFMHVVGLVYNHIHCCPKDCIIYYGKYKDYTLALCAKVIDIGMGKKGAKILKKVYIFLNMF